MTLLVILSLSLSPSQKFFDRKKNLEFYISLILFLVSINSDSAQRAHLDLILTYYYYYFFFLRGILTYNVGWDSPRRVLQTTWEKKLLLCVISIYYIKLPLIYSEIAMLHKNNFLSCKYLKFLLIISKRDTFVCGVLDVCLWGSVLVPLLLGFLMFVCGGWCLAVALLFGVCFSFGVVLYCCFFGLFW